MRATLFIAPDPGGPLRDFITLYTGIELTRRMRLGQMRIHLTSIIWIIEHARYELHPVCYNCGANILSFSGNTANNAVYNLVASRYWSILCWWCTFCLRCNFSTQLPQRSKKIVWSYPARFNTPASFTLAIIILYIFSLIFTQREIKGEGKREYL